MSACICHFSYYTDRASSRAHSEPDLRFEAPLAAATYPMAGGGGGVPRYFIALYDYDPRHMSPNPNAVIDELCFRKGQIIKVITCTARHMHCITPATHQFAHEKQRCDANLRCTETKTLMVFIVAN